MINNPSLLTVNFNFNIDFKLVISLTIVTLFVVYLAQANRNSNIQ